MCECVAFIVAEILGVPGNIHRVLSKLVEPMGLRCCQCLSNLSKSTRNPVMFTWFEIVPEVMHRCLSELAKSGEEFVDVPEFLTIVTYFVGFINNVFDVRRSLWDASPNLVICVGIQIRRVTQGSCRLCVPSDEILEESSDFSSEFVTTS